MASSALFPRIYELHVSGDTSETSGSSLWPPVTRSYKYKVHKLSYNTKNSKFEQPTSAKFWNQPATRSMQTEMPRYESNVTKIKSKIHGLQKRATLDWMTLLEHQEDEQ